MNDTVHSSKNPQPTAASLPSIDTMNRSTWTNHSFTSGHTRAIWVIGLLALVLCANLFATGSTILQIQLLIRAKTTGITQQEATANDLRQQVMGLIQSVLYIGSAIAFLMWIHRAYRNLPSLGATSLSYSPGWAVGYFFIPILNLFRPYQVMREIWRESYPYVTFDAFGQEAAKPSLALIWWWWAFFLLMSFAGNFSMRASMYAKTLDALLLSSWITMASDLISVPAALLAILLVWRIDRAQLARHEELQTMAATS